MINMGEGIIMANCIFQWNQKLNYDNLGGTEKSFSRATFRGVGLYLQPTELFIRTILVFLNYRERENVVFLLELIKRYL